MASILQYSNTGAEEDVKVEPHKNAKKSIQPFYATATSTKQHISDKAKTPLGPSSIYDELYEEEGGIIDSASFAELPRGIRQVKYQRSKLSDQYAKDTLEELLYLPVYKSTFYSLKICPKNRPRLIHGSKTEIKKSSGQISIIIVSCGNKHPLLHDTSYSVFSLINLSS